MISLAQKGEQLKTLNNSVFVTDGASVGEHDGRVLTKQNNKKIINHNVIGSDEAVDSAVSPAIIYHQ